MSPGDFRRKELLQGLQHDVAPFAIDPANQLHVLVEKSIACNFVSYELREGRGVQIRALLELRQFGDHLWRSDDPSQTKPGSQRLGECAQVNYVADRIAIVAPQILAIEDHQRRQMLTFITQL